MVTQFVAMPQSPAVVAMAQPQQVGFCVRVGDLWGLWGKMHGADCECRCRFLGSMEKLR